MVQMLGITNRVSGRVKKQQQQNKWHMAGIPETIKVGEVLVLLGLELQGGNSHRLGVLEVMKKDDLVVS